MKALKITGVILSIIAVCIAGTGIYLSKGLPNTGPAPDLHIESTVRRIERGKYLAHHVAVCMDCHSKRDWSLYSGPITDGNLGGGGESFNKEMGFPGNVYASNITPYKLANWSDGEIFRAITTGVNKEGKALFPVMSYHRFGRMDKEDIFSMIAYIRTLTAVRKEVPQSTLDFPMNFLVNTLPKAPSFTVIPDKKNTIAYGAYLVNVAGCVDCHSKIENGKVVEGTEFRGGMEIRQPAGVLIVPNITFDKNSRIANWNKDIFLQKFQQYGDSNYKPLRVAPNELNTPMPWTMYAGMSAEDLGAIYDFLKSVNPITP